MGDLGFARGKASWGSLQNRPAGNWQKRQKKSCPPDHMNIKLMKSCMVLFRIYVFRWQEAVLQTLPELSSGKAQIAHGVGTYAEKLYAMPGGILGLFR